MYFWCFGGKGSRNQQKLVSWSNCDSDSGTLFIVRQPVLNLHNFAPWGRHYCPLGWARLGWGFANILHHSKELFPQVNEFKPRSPVPPGVLGTVVQDSVYLSFLQESRGPTIQTCIQMLIPGLCWFWRTGLGSPTGRDLEELRMMEWPVASLWEGLQIWSPRVGNPSELPHI